MTGPPPGRAADLVAALRLAAHPEGGWYREVFRSRRMVQTPDGRGERWAVTVALFLVTASPPNRLHRVASDEVWHFVEGSPLSLHIVDPEVTARRTVRLGPAGADSAPVQVVPARCWQCAVPDGPFALVACDVAPGFEFGDFRLVDREPAVAARVRRRWPDLAAHCGGEG